MPAKLILEILGEASGAVAALAKTKSATKDTEASTKSATKTLASVAGGVAAGFAVERVVEFGKSTIEAAEGAEVANRKLEQAFKGAGGGAEEAAKHSISFADALSGQIGVAPDVIKNTEAMLATFHAVSGEAERTSGVFDGATKAAADLASAGFGSMTDNAKTLGVALSDPAKGITRLRRLGVTLTEAQTEQIKALSGTGTASKAAAAHARGYESATTALTKAQDHLKVVQGEVATGQLKGKAAASALRIAHAGVTEKLLEQTQAHQKLGKAQAGTAKAGTTQANLLKAQKLLLGDVSGAVGGMASKTATASAKASAGYQAMKEQLGTQLLPIFDSVMSKLTGLMDFVSKNSGWLIPLVSGLVGLAAAAMGVAKAIEIVKAVVEGMRIVWQLLNLAFLQSPIGWIVLALVGLGVTIYLLWTRVAWFRDAVKAAWKVIESAFSATINAIKIGISAFIGFIQKWGQLLLLVLTGPFYLVFKLILAAVHGGWSGVMAQIGAWAGMISGALSRVLAVITRPFTAAWGIIYNGLIAPVKGAFTGVAGAIAGALAGVTHAITAPFVNVWNFISAHIIGPLKSTWNGIANTVNRLSISSPGLKVAGHTIIPSFTWRPPFRIPTLDQGGLITSTGIVYAHAGEVISPAPCSVRAGAGGNVYISLNVPATANPAEVGRQTVRMLQAYVRAQGPDSLTRALGL